MTDHDLYPCPPGSRAGQYDLFMDALRDRFAAAALTGMLASLTNEDRINLVGMAANARLEYTDYIADAAYNFADAMMARRSAPRTAPSSAQPQGK